MVGLLVMMLLEEEGVVVEMVLRLLRARTCGRVGRGKVENEEQEESNEKDEDGDEDGDEEEERRRDWVEEWKELVGVFSGIVEERSWTAVREETARGNARFIHTLVVPLKIIFSLLPFLLWAGAL